VGKKMSRIDQQATGDHYLEDVGDEQQHVSGHASLGLKEPDWRPPGAMYWGDGCGKGLVPGWYAKWSNGAWFFWPMDPNRKQHWHHCPEPEEGLISLVREDAKVNLNHLDDTHADVEALPEGAQFYCPESNQYFRLSNKASPDQTWTEGAGWQFYAPLASREGLIELDYSGDTTEKANHIPGAGKKPSMAELYPDYYRDVRHLDEMDVYAVHDTFRVDDPSGCLQHASKKILLSGTRNGGKSLAQDIKEARDTLTRKLQLMGVE